MRETAHKYREIFLEHGRITLLPKGQNWHNLSNDGTSSNYDIIGTITVKDLI